MRPPPHAIGLIGDSITEACSPTAPSAPRCYLTSANELLDHRFEVVAYAGKGGDTTEGMLARLDADVISKHPEVAVVFGGANDMLAYAPSTRVARTLTALRSMAVELETAGIIPVVSTVAPSFSFDDIIGADWLTVNAAIRAADGFPPGTIIADLGGAMSGDPPYHPAPELVTDAIHPNDRGAAAIGAAAASALAPLWPPALRVVLE